MNASAANNASLLLSLAIQATQAGLAYQQRVQDAQSGGAPISEEELDKAAAAVGTSRAALLAADAARTAKDADAATTG